MSTPATPMVAAARRRPLAAHEDMVKDPAVFWDALRIFHSHNGTKFMVPVIGGKELNLYVLYVEVTGKGGYDKVVLEKKWREISNVFSFSPTTTSASYALRKHYFGLLYHFELVHFLHQDHHQFSLDSSSSSSSSIATGTIDGKFDCGYMVTVKLGSETLNGVLYFPDESAGGSTTPVVPIVKPCTAIVPFDKKETVVGGKRRSRRRRKGGDPNRPKPNRSGYNFFFAEKHSSLKTMYPEKEKERQFTKMIGESWNKLTAEERVVYQNYGLKDKERYQRELKEYTERLKMVAGEGCSVTNEANNNNNNN